MSIKAIVTIDSYTLYDDQTYAVVCSICNDGHSGGTFATVGPFAANTASATVNSAIRDAAVEHIETAWELTFTPIVDSIKILNPINVVGL